MTSIKMFSSCLRMCHSCVRPDGPLGHQVWKCKQAKNQPSKTKTVSNSILWFCHCCCCCCCYATTTATFGFCFSGRFFRSYSRLCRLQKQCFGICWSQTFYKPDSLAVNQPTRQLSEFKNVMIQWLHNLYICKLPRRINARNITMD